MNRKKYVQQFLNWRERCYSLYVSYGKYAGFLMRFGINILVLALLAHFFEYQPSLSHPGLLVGMAIVGACLPAALQVLIFCMYAMLQICFLSPILTGMMAVWCIILYMMCLRYAKESILLFVLVPIAILCKIPLFPAIVGGLFFSPSCVLTVAGGVVMYDLLLAVKQCEPLVAQKTGPLALFEQAMDAVVENQEMGLLLAGLCVITILVYALRTRKINYAFEAGICFAVVFYVIILLIGALVLSCKISLVAVWLGALLSGVLAFVVHWCHMVLDYEAVEDVQFEDEHYYYYVHAVPKLYPEEKPADKQKTGNSQNMWNVKIK